MTTENTAPEISSDDLLSAYQQFATEEMRLARQIAALTEEMLSARESKEEAFAELMKRG
jgi:hypothetical protein